MLTPNPKSKTILYVWIAAEILVAGWFGWQIATAQTRQWAPPTKTVKIRRTGPR